jgi:hypothetical protein
MIAHNPEEKLDPQEPRRGTDGTAPPAPPLLRQDRPSSAPLSNAVAHTLMDCLLQIESEIALIGSEIAQIHRVLMEEVGL